MDIFGNPHNIAPHRDAGGTTYRFELTNSGVQRILPGLEDQ